MLVDNQPWLSNLQCSIYQQDIEYINQLALIQYWMNMCLSGNQSQSSNNYGDNIFQQDMPELLNHRYNLYLTNI